MKTTTLQTILIIELLVIVLLLGAKILFPLVTEGKYELITAFLTFLTFIGVIMTVVFQNRINRRNQRQSDIQNFESILFRMLDLQQTIVNGIEHHKIIRDPDNEEKFIEESAKGRRAFELLYNKYTLIVLLKYGLKNGYERDIHLPLFDHYFRHLYRILKFINQAVFLDESPEIFTERYKYAAIVRATLSRYELIWIFYNCLSSYGIEKFKPLVERYALLKNIRWEDLGMTKEIVEYNHINKPSCSPKEYYTTDNKDDDSKYIRTAFPGSF